MKEIFQKTYKISPIWLQNLMISGYGCLLAYERYGGTYWSELNRLKNRDLADFEKQKAIQNTLFLEFLNYTMHYSPFYQEFYKDVDFSKIKTVDDIGCLPILDKETLRKNIHKIYTTENVPTVLSMTGGTTGKSLVVKVTKEDNQKGMAYLDWFKSLYGFNMLKDRHARFNGKDIIPMGQKRKIFWRDNSFIKQRIYSSFYLSEENLPYYIRDLNRYKPTEMDGFCSTMYEIAHYMKKHNIKADFSPKGIFTTSETVLPYHRQTLEDVFGCKVYDQYASSEGAPLIVEFPDGCMHECLDTGVFEHLKSSGGTKLVVTSFLSHGTPLIRYDIGDNIVECDESDRPDNNIGFPAIKGIDGRSTDFLFSKERGRINSANMANVVKYLPNSLINIQYIQDNTSHIHIKMVVDKATFRIEDEKKIINEMIVRLGEKMDFSVEYVDSIPRAKSGKYRLVINELSDFNE